MTQYKIHVVPNLQGALTRRRILLGLTAAISLAAAPYGSQAQGSAKGGSFLAVSRVIAGNDALSPDVAKRIEGLLAKRTDSFAAQLDDLAAALEGVSGSREQKLSKLSDEQVKFALLIAKPWYLGFVGTPSDFVLDDDAVFATFLEGQSWEKIIDEVPRPTYPGAGAGWWSEAPPHVKAPDMPADITRWNFHPPGPAQIQAPDPEWKAYATAEHGSIDAARGAKPAHG